MTVELEDKLSPDLNRATRHDPKGIVVEIRAAHFGKATGAAISPDGKWLVHVIDDGAHQSFDWQHIDGVRYPHVIEKECVGCNLCYLICPSPGAITMKRIDRRPTGVMARPHRRQLVPTL